MKFVSLFSQAAVVSVICAISSLALANSKTVTIATGEYAPMVSAELENGGVVSHLVSVVFQEAGYEASFELMPWKRALEMTRRGHFPATSYWYSSEEREADFIQVGPIFEERLLFFRKKSDEPFVWSELSDLAGLRIGVVDGYTYTSELWDLGAQGVFTIEKGPTDVANLRKLLAERIDLYPISEATGLHLLSSEFTADERAQFEIVDKPLSVVDANLLFSRSVDGAQSVADDFASALLRLRAEGTLPEVIEALTQE